jgi:metallo-beta-lactamase class B
MRSTLIRVLLLSVLSVSIFAQRNASQRAEWNRPMPPFRIIGNIYYVGVSGISSFLITTPAGDILLDGGLPESAHLIERNIAALGFHLNDVKYLLNSHAHFDHAGGLAELKRLSGAQLIVSKADSRTVNAGGSSMPAVSVDRTIGGNGTVQLGGTTLTAHLTPGHTPGCTTWTMTAAENGRNYRVVFFCSTSVAGNHLVNNRQYPQIVSDYEHSFAVLRQMPCDVFLGAHGEFFHLDEKRALLGKGGPNPFINPAEFRAYIDESQRDFERELKRQAALRRKS